jgi:hypothetical protein
VQQPPKIITERVGFIKTALDPLSRSGALAQSELDELLAELRTRYPNLCDAGISALWQGGYMMGVGVCERRVLGDGVYAAFDDDLRTDGGEYVGRSLDGAGCYVSVPKDFPLAVMLSDWCENFSYVVEFKAGLIDLQGDLQSGFLDMETRKYNWGRNEGKDGINGQQFNDTNLMGLSAGLSVMQKVIDVVEEDEVTVRVGVPAMFKMCPFKGYRRAAAASQSAEQRQRFLCSAEAHRAGARAVETASRTHMLRAHHSAACPHVPSGGGASRLPAWGFCPAPPW